MTNSILNEPKIKNKFIINKVKNLSVFKLNYEKLLTIRFVEEKISDEVLKGNIKTPCHLSIGQEAIAIGMSRYFKKGDSVYSTHRSHAHFFASGGSLEKLISEIMGSHNGASKGMGGSMHLYHNEYTKFFSTPIVAGTIPISLGSAYYFKHIKKSKNLSICFFGDGATEEGVFHESMNFASRYDLPIIFICENNLYSSHLDIKLRQTSDYTKRFADSFGIKSKIVNGNNIEEVANATQDIFEYSRKNSKPSYIEAVTFRLVGHVGGSLDIDVGVRRNKEELDNWIKKDPVKLIEDYLIKNKIYSEKTIKLKRQFAKNIVSNIFIKCQKNFKNPKKDFLDKFHRSNFNER